MPRVTLALVLVLLAWSPAAAETTPTEALQEVFGRANQILTDPATAERPLERLLGIRKLVNEAFDFRGAAELASGERWQARTAAEQEEFTWLFADLLERGFVAQMAAKASLAGGTRIQYLIEAVDGDTARVMTAMGRKDGRDLLVGYRLVERDGAWKIRDVTMDGVSLMENYRAQLDRVLGTASFPELLTQMRAKVGTPEPATVDGAAGDGPVPAEETLAPVEMLAIVDVPFPEPEIRLATYELPPDEPSPITVAVEEPTVAPRPRTLTTKAYWLRFVDPGSPDEARRLVSRLHDGRHSVGLERTSADGHSSLSVRLGPFRDAEEAVLELLALQAKGHDPYLIAERE